MAFMLSNIAQNAHSYGFRVSGLVSRDTLLKISFSEVWMQTSVSFQHLYLLRYDLDLRKPDLRKNLDLRKIVATTDFLVHKLLDLRKVF